jgi:two-component system, OmpR family, response regulator CpxR
MGVRREKTLTRTSEKFLQWRECPINIGVTLQSGSFAVRIHSALEHQSSETPSFSRAASKSTMKPKRTILCVDDNEQSLSIRKVMLETRGYRVITCNGGEQALEIFKKGGIDLVLTDLIMPGLDGTKLVEQVKSISPQTPAILLSGKVKIYDRDTQADVFLPKGMYAPVELLERIRLLLIRKRGPKRAQSRSRSAAQTSAA